MPELPEVETTRRGIEPYLVQQTIAEIIIRDHRLRWPIDLTLPKYLPGQTIQQISRRGKYLLLHCTDGVLIIHLGMSGNLRILKNHSAADKHDHVDIILTNGICLRFNDPRRFGCVLWTDTNPLLHPLLKNLGPEPLTKSFNSNYLYQNSRDRSAAIKLFIMDAKIVVGVGNIYANEALFQAGIHPKKAAKKIHKESYEKLTQTIKHVLKAAIKQGGTTLRNFITSDGQPGYFKQHLQVYDRGGLPCLQCQTKLREIRLGQRATVYCPKCQS
jgi:formamidopyrimidine-DNA glycosylase